MNRTAKLLKKYSTQMKIPYRPLKRWWTNLSWNIKHEERKRIKKELGLGE